MLYNIDVYLKTEEDAGGGSVLTIIGLSGGSGSGKTTAAAVMASLGAAVIDTDRVYRDLCVPGSPCLSELAGVFGKEILLPDGALDRKKLGALVFSDAAARLRLNAITHAYIAEKTKRLIKEYDASGMEAVVIDAPLLFESGFDAFCDITVGVTAPLDVRMARIIARDGLTAEEAEKRIASQLSDEELSRRCDFIIENRGTNEELVRAVESFYMNAVGGIRS